MIRLSVQTMFRAKGSRSELALGEMHNDREIASYSAERIYAAQICNAGNHTVDCTTSAINYR